MDLYHYRVVVYTHCQHTFQFKQHVKVHVTSDDPFNNGCLLQTHSFSLHKTWIDGLESCDVLVDYFDVYQLFGLSFWWHPFTAEDPLMSKWCNGTFLQICSISSTHLHFGWLEGKYIFSNFFFLLFLLSQIKHCAAQKEVIYLPLMPPCVYCWGSGSRASSARHRVVLTLHPVLHFTQLQKNRHLFIYTHLYTKWLQGNRQFSPLPFQNVFSK